MRIGIGSKNPVKVNALIEIIPLYDFLKDAEVISVDVLSGVSEQPKSLAETVRGAKKRAHQAYNCQDLGVGIESGLMVVPGTKTGMMDCCVCSIYNGKDYAIGISSAFECPQSVVNLVRFEGYDLNKAFKKIGMTDDPKIGYSEGAIGLLTKGRVPRLDYTKQAITMALIQLENAVHYLY